jgi:hypothetical protein
MLLDRDIEVWNFVWKGSPNGICIGSEPPDLLWMTHKPIKVALYGCYCDDIGDNAITIYNKADVLLENCTFRGNWKLNKSGPDCVGQKHILKINAGTVTIRKCKFFNSINPILINANSKVIIENCDFGICDYAISINGQPNPRKNVEIDGGKEGESHVEIAECNFFKTNLLAKVERGGIVKTSVTIPPSFIDGGTIIYENDHRPC